MSTCAVSLVLAIRAKISLPFDGGFATCLSSRQYNTGRYSSLSGQVMGHHKEHETESTARTDSAAVSTILTPSFLLPQRSARVECPCISKYETKQPRLVSYQACPPNPHCTFSWRANKPFDMHTRFPNHSHHHQHPNLPNRPRPFC